MKHPKIETLLPAEIINNWDERLRMAECSTLQSEQMMLLIRKTLPHPSIASVEQCLTGLVAAFKTVGGSATALSEDAVCQVCEKLDEAGQMAARSRFRLSHPVASAIKKIQNTAASRKVDPGPWLNWFLALCGQAQNHSESLTRATYYHHTLYARDVAIFVMRHQATGTLVPDQSVDQACRQLSDWFQQEARTGEPMPIPVTGAINMDEKIDVVTRLLDGSWKFGIPSKKRKKTQSSEEETHQSNGNVLPPTKKPTKSTPLPKILTPTTEALKAAQPTKKELLSNLVYDHQAAFLPD